MKIVSWNIRGCNHPRNIKTLARNIKQERPDVLFLQETKCSFEAMKKLRQKIWKGSRVMATDADRMAGGMAVLWRPSIIDLSEWRSNHLSLIAKFKFSGSRIIGTLVNGYGPSAFPQKHAFPRLLH